MCCLQQWPIHAGLMKAWTSRPEQNATIMWSLQHWPIHAGLMKAWTSWPVQNNYKLSHSLEERSKQYSMCVTNWTAKNLVPGNDLWTQIGCSKKWEISEFQNKNYRYSINFFVCLTHACFILRHTTRNQALATQFKLDFTKRKNTVRQYTWGYK